MVYLVSPALIPGAGGDQDFLRAALLITAFAVARYRNLEPRVQTPCGWEEVGKKRMDFLIDDAIGSVIGDPKGFRNTLVCGVHGYKKTISGQRPR